MMRANQIKGLVDFEVRERNIGLVFVNFLNENLDKTYAIRFISALKFMKERNQKHVKLEELSEIDSLELELFFENGDRYYNLEGVDGRWV